MRNATYFSQHYVTFRNVTYIRSVMYFRRETYCFCYVTMRVSFILFKCCVASRLYAQRRIIFRNVPFIAVLGKVFSQRHVAGFVGSRFGYGPP